MSNVSKDEMRSMSGYISRQTYMEAYIHDISMTMCNIVVFQCGCFKMGFQLEDLENIFILPHILITTFFMYMTHIISNNYNQSCPLLMVC